MVVLLKIRNKTACKYGRLRKNDFYILHKMTISLCYFIFIDYIYSFILNDIFFQQLIYHAKINKIFTLENN